MGTFVRMMSTVPLLLLLSASLALARSPLEKEPRFTFTDVSGGGTYKPGQTATLSARVTDDDNLDENDDWKVCTWTRLRDGAYCRFIYECDGFLCDIGSGDFYITYSCTS